MATGDLYIVGTQSDAIWTYRSNAWLPNSLALPSEGGSTISNPRGLAVDPTNGDILVVDWSSDKFYRYNGTSWGTGIAVPATCTLPSGLAVAPNGDVLVVDLIADNFWRYSNGTWDSGTTLADTTNDAMGIAVDPANSDVLVVHDEGATFGVYRYSSGSWGARLAGRGGSSQAEGVAFHSDGRLLVVNNNPDRIDAYNFTTQGWGQLVGSLPSGENAPRAIAFDTYTPPTLPDAEAPTVDFTGLTELTLYGNQNATLSVNLSGGTYDALSYLWTVSEGTLSANNIPNPILDPPNNPGPMAGTITVTCTITAVGIGTVAADGTSESATAMVDRVWGVGNAPLPPELEAAEAPTLTIPPVASFNEQTSTTITANVTGGRYDTIEYAWVALFGGTITGTGSSVTFTAPTVGMDTSLSVHCTVTVRGTGGDALAHTSDAVTAFVTFTVLNTSSELMNAEAPAISIAEIPDLNEGDEHTVVVTLTGGTYDAVTVTATQITGTIGVFTLQSNGTYTATYVAGTVDADTQASVQIHATATGAGTNALASTSDTEVLVSNTFTISDVGGFSLPSIVNQSLRVGQAYTFTFPEALNATGTVTYSLTSDLAGNTAASIDGLTFTAATRVLAGTPSAVLGSTTFYYHATDDNDTITQSFVLSVIPSIASDENPSHFSAVDQGGRIFRLSWRAPMGATRYAVSTRLRDLITGDLTQPAWLPADITYSDNHTATFVDTQTAPGGLWVIQLSVTAFEGTQTEISATVYGTVIIPPTIWAPEHQLLCDWDRNGSPTDEYANVLRATADIGRQNDLLNSPINPSLGVTWSNESERYTDYASSPLAGKLIPGFDVTFQLVNHGQTIPIFKGTASEIGADGESRLARMAADGPLTVLSDVILEETNNITAFDIANNLMEALGIGSSQRHTYGMADSVVRYAAQGSAQQVLRQVQPVLHQEDAHAQLHGGFSVTPSGRIRIDAGHWADGVNIDAIRQAGRPALGSNIRSMTNRIGARLTTVEPGTGVISRIGLEPGPAIRESTTYISMHQFRIYRIDTDTPHGYAVDGVAYTPYPFISGALDLKGHGTNGDAVVDIPANILSNPQTRIFWLPRPIYNSRGQGEYIYLNASGQEVGFSVATIRLINYHNDSGLGALIVSIPALFNTGTVAHSYVRLPIKPNVATNIDAQVRDQTSADTYRTRRHTLGTIPQLVGDTGDVLIQRILDHRKAPRRHVTQRYQVVDEETAQLLAFQSGDVVTHNDRRYRILRKVYNVSAGRAPEMDITIIEAAPSGVT